MNKTNLKTLRKEAKTLKQLERLKTYQAQQIIASQYGFKDWRQAVSALQDKAFIFSLPISTDLPEQLASIVVAPTIRIEKNDFFSVVGRSGSGKSLLLKLASRQALSQGFEVVYLGYYGTIPVYEEVDFSDLDGHPNFHSFTHDACHDVQTQTSFKASVSILVESLGPKRIIIVDESEYLAEFDLTWLLEFEAQVFLSSQTFGDLLENALTVKDHNVSRVSILALELSRNNRELESFLHLTKGKSETRITGITPLLDCLEQNSANIWFGGDQIAGIPRIKELVTKIT
ncbi:hypothetical protein ASL83_003400 [Vibrio parahaemolyticus]|nr:hypothetical protein [Vibrio parahaemolyticus]EJO2025997.1 hypothetical protein [Vibrio parahaemolyticus]